MTPSLKSSEIFTKECQIVLVLRECFNCEWKNYCQETRYRVPIFTFEERYTHIIGKIRKKKLEKLLS